MSGALCIRYGRTLLLLCKKCGGTVRAPAPAFPALERPAALPPPAGSRPVPAAPTAGREIPVPQGLRFSAYRPAAFFAPARDVKAAASPRPPNFHGPIGKTAGQVYQTTISDSGISFAGITPESPGTVGNITDGSGCGTASIAEACRRVRAPIKLTEYGAHAIGSSKKVWGSFAGEPGSKTVSPRGKDVHSQYGLQQPSSHSSGFPRCGHRHAALCPGLLRPVCGSCSGGLRFCFRAGRRKSRRDLRETGGKECSFFRRRLSGHAFLAAVCIGYQRFCAAWAAACCKARICCA